MKASFGAVILLNCAWLVWYQMIGFGPSGLQWEYESSHQTYEECLARLKAKAEGATGNLHIELDGSRLTARSQKDQTATVLTCIPDTIDPRAPKH
jgi:hypothetical protein